MSDDAETIVRRRDRPLGRCARCHAVVRTVDEIGKKCARPLRSGVRCPGVIRSALPADEWTECVDCHAPWAAAVTASAHDATDKAGSTTGQSLAVEGRRDLQGES